jgi:hypothetical protein
MAAASGKRIHRLDERMMRMGRPTILTQEITQQLCAHIERGLPKEKACYLVGIDERTLHLWIEKGSAEDAEEIYVALMRSVKSSEARFAQSALGNMADLAKAGNKNWTAYGWMLERLQPGSFAKVDRLEVTGKEGGPIESVTNVVGASDEEIERLAAGKGKRKST